MRRVRRQGGGPCGKGPGLVNADVESPAEELAGETVVRAEVLEAEFPLAGGALAGEGGEVSEGPQRAEPGGPIKSAPSGVTTSPRSPTT